MDWSSLICQLKYLVNWIFGHILDLFAAIGNVLLALLPQTPFSFKQIEWGDWGTLVGYFIPIADMLSSFTILLISIGLYYLVRNLLRLIRMVR